MAEPEPDQNEQKVSMNDIVAYNAAGDEPAPQVAQVDLFSRLRELQHPAKAVPEGVSVPGRSKVKLAVAGLLGIVILGGAAFAALQFSQPKRTAVTSPTVSPKATPKPSARPTRTPTPRPRPIPPPASAPASTYTVQPGDTLITIGEKLKKDWRAIAAANGDIRDPNLIHPGQVLKIP